MAPAVCLLLIAASILYGAKNITMDTVWDSIFAFDPESIDHQIIMSSRLPRVVGAMLIGAFGGFRGFNAGDDKKLFSLPSIMGYRTVRCSR